VADLL
jgi:predicted metal-dependent phosphoesterase TrpH